MRVEVTARLEVKGEKEIYYTIAIVVVVIR
jgi:hypothetical protein